mmetsp:Transcript_34073/g.80205  ORF Transcript_34073/g.80205 Transcript_34073/m.80205 type:complete len:208 (+) Transcript_34073:1280-1903(+)
MGVDAEMEELVYSVTATDGQSSKGLSRPKPGKMLVTGSVTDDCCCIVLENEGSTSTSFGFVVVVGGATKAFAPVVVGEDEVMIVAMASAARPYLLRVKEISRVLLLLKLLPANLRFLVGDGLGKGLIVVLLRAAFVWSVSNLESSLFLPLLFHGMFGDCDLLGLCPGVPAIDFSGMTTLMLVAGCLFGTGSYGMLENILKFRCGRGF